MCRAYRDSASVEGAWGVEDDMGFQAHIGVQVGWLEQYRGIKNCEHPGLPHMDMIAAVPGQLAAATGWHPSSC